jgi:hypothetical protein
MAGAKTPALAAQQHPKAGAAYKHNLEPCSEPHVAPGWGHPTAKYQMPIYHLDNTMVCPVRVFDVLLSLKQEIQADEKTKPLLCALPIGEVPHRCLYIKAC